ncbi:restriction endonuclease subunit S [Streptococcus suis]|uniref:restriction endonuclease subunit S n=1 Tax=Streptococcus suis TaxID=1307 RepID=UPI000CF54ADA|nr:restriction endonuclease subunit S [Streptococcus suis]
MTKEKPTEPRLRFPGFTDAWKQRKLGEVAERVSQKNLDRQYVETFTNSAEFGIISQRDFFEKNISSLENLSGYYVVNPDDFVYNPRISNLAPVGPIKRNKLGRVGVMSPLYTIFKFTDMNLDFVEKYFDTTIWHRYMELNGDSGARSDRFAIKDSVFRGLPIPHPSLPEQEAIGSFFSDLDQLITLHQRKLDSVKGLKKALLQKMFPKGNGNDFPELRFPEFTDAWKQRKLGEVLDERNESRSPSADVPLVSFTVENGVTPKTERYNREFLVRNDDKKYKFTQLDDIVYNPANLKFGAIARNKYGAAVFSPIYITYTVIPDASPIFIELVVTFADFIQRALRYQEGTVYERMAVKSSDLLRSEILLPTLPEQEAIGSFFSDLDQLITLHQRQLDHLKLLKKALLQQMFI